MNPTRKTIQEVVYKKLGNLKTAVNWMETPQVALNNMSPAEYIKTKKNIDKLLKIVNNL